MECSKRFDHTPVKIVRTNGVHLKAHDRFSSSSVLSQPALFMMIPCYFEGKRRAPFHSSWTISYAYISQRSRSQSRSDPTLFIPDYS